MLGTFVTQAQDILEDKLVRPDSSIGAGEHKFKIITGGKAESKDVT